MCPRTCKIIEVSDFVGIINRNTQYFIATEEGIVTCATVRRLPDGEAYDKSCLSDIKIHYNDYIRDGARSKPIGVRIAVTKNTTAPDPNPIVSNYRPRGLQLRKDDFSSHGFTGGCPGCEFLATGLGGRRPHSAECRLRMGELLAGDE